ncbi:uncharacterized protein F4812DRAFT_419621 [Daldinia caldariorum]|uniref:uncharacterized protein n=1 Tax=Daldinia caldariorum TaxID=326644 RepID=UPI0020078BF7|nr:uncharacterized protein F4812DRAFT_419621 [Daldinia caldariorum]KAI1470957.1 hypothetical protein F4812DRAFT_419621 [Daldinia caldariorum]
MASLRKFPFSFGVGTDICRIPRIYSLLTKNRGVNFVRRVLTQEEINAVRASSKVLEPVFHEFKPSSNDSNGERDRQYHLAILDAARFMAGRWAAKEAVIKACNIYRVTFHDITITYEHQLAKSLRNKGSSSHPMAEQSPSPSDSQEIEKPRQTSPPVAVIKGHGTGDMYGRLSISHDGDYAVATCVTFWGEPDDDVSGVD